MARQPHYYEALRDAQREALENVAEAAPLEPTVAVAAEAEHPAPIAEQEEPTRPEGHYGQSSFVWRGEGDLVSETTAAIGQVKFNAAQRNAAWEASGIDPTEAVPAQVAALGPEVSDIKQPEQTPTPQVAPEAGQSQGEAASSFNDAAVEMTDNRVARAQQLASLVQESQDAKRPEQEFEPNSPEL